MEIGTGKTTVAKVFECFGIPVLQADSLARYMMQHDTMLIEALQNEFGKGIYQNGVLQK
ncbi:MAG: dephospho-CoA kinase [Taibaiella sp.]|nr:dephospho-CoA kinase [Taibaiella sp.]